MRRNGLWAINREIIFFSGRMAIRRKEFMRKAVSGLQKPARQDEPCSKLIDDMNNLLTFP